MCHAVGLPSCGSCGLPVRGRRQVPSVSGGGGEGVPAGGQQRALVGGGQEGVAIEEAVGDLQQRAVAAVVAHQHACSWNSSSTFQHSSLILKQKIFCALANARNSEALLLNKPGRSLKVGTYAYACSIPSGSLSVEARHADYTPWPETLGGAHAQQLSCKTSGAKRFYNQPILQAAGSNATLHTAFSAVERAKECVRADGSPVAGARLDASRRGTSSRCASMKRSSREIVRPSPSPPPVAAATERTTGPSCLQQASLRHRYATTLLRYMRALQIQHVKILTSQLLRPGLQEVEWQCAWRYIDVI